MDKPRKNSVCIRLTDAEYEAVSRYAAERNWTITKVLVEGFDALQGRDSKEEADDIIAVSSDANPVIQPVNDIEAASL